MSRKASETRVLPPSILSEWRGLRGLVAPRRRAGGSRTQRSARPLSLAKRSRDLFRRKSTEDRKLEHFPAGGTDSLEALEGRRRQQARSASCQFHPQTLRKHSLRRKIVLAVRTTRVDARVARHKRPRALLRDAQPLAARVAAPPDPACEVRAGRGAAELISDLKQHRERHVLTLSRA